jgi:hypothetical protein
MMTGGLEEQVVAVETAVRAEASKVERLACTVAEPGTPTGGGWSMACWMSRRRRTRWVAWEGPGVVDGVEHGLPDNVELLPLLLAAIGLWSELSSDGTPWNRVDDDVIHRDRRNQSRRSIYVAELIGVSSLDVNEP